MRQERWTHRWHSGLDSGSAVTVSAPRDAARRGDDRFPSPNRHRLDDGGQLSSSRSVPVAAAVRRNFAQLDPGPGRRARLAFVDECRVWVANAGSARSTKTTSPGPTGPWRTTSALSSPMITFYSCATTSTHSPRH